MLKKTVTYVDFDGNERTEDFYFNLTESELAEFGYSINGGMKQYLEKIIAEKDEQKLVESFKKIVLMSYGVKSPDGRLFLKNDKVREEFVSNAAYSDIFMEMAHDADKAAAFINAVMPKSRETGVPDIAALPGKGPAGIVRPSGS